MHTLCSGTSLREAPKRSLTNLGVEIFKPFHGDGNRCADLLLEFRYKSASVGNKAHRGDKRMDTLGSNHREELSRSLTNT